MESFGQLQAPRFNGSNFTSWKYRLLNILESKDLSDLLTMEAPEADPAKSEFRKKDAQTKAIITSLMSDTQVSLILTCRTSKEIFDTMTRRYEGDIKKSVIEAKNAVNRLQMKKEESWRDYLLRAEKMLQHARILGATIPDDEFISTLIKGLPTRYNLVAMQFDNFPDATINDVYRIFKNHQERSGLIEKEENSKAYKVNWRENRTSRNFERRNDKQQKIICYTCHKPNHKSSECWHNKYRKENGNKTDTRKNKFQKAKVAKEETEDNQTKPKEQSYSVKNAESSSKGKFVLDSGCTSHMTNDINLMDEIQDDERTVTLADNSNIKSEAIGTVELLRNDQKHLKLKKVLYVPKLSSNLISVSKLVQDNKRVIFDINGGHIIDADGNKLVTAKRIDEFYVIDPDDKEDTVLKTGGVSWNDWHRRLGHVNEKYMKIMKKDKLVHMFETDSEDGLENCTTCIQAKLSRKPFKTVTSSQSSSILDLLHMDLIGPIQEPSIGGARYIFTIIDDFSRKIFTRFLKRKSETVDILKEFVEKIENKTEKRVKTIRSDNGSEYLNADVAKYCRSKGIEHQLTVAFSPAQNGIAERANRSLIEGTRALLIEADLPIKFWAEAMNTFTYVKNRTPSKRNLKMTPEEIFSGRKPTISHLRIFGCKCFFWIPKQKREGKFAQTAKPGIFTGYSRNRKAYRICDPVTFETTESRDVKFLEDVKGSELLQTQRDENNIDYTLINLDDTIPGENPQQGQTMQRNEDRISEDDNGPTSENSDSEDYPEESGDIDTTTLRRNRRQINYYESPLSGEESEAESPNDPSYEPGDVIMKTRDNPDVPVNYETAVSVPDKKMWIEAMNKEISSLNEHHVWDIVTLPDGVKPIKCKWVYTKKKNQEGHEIKYKARLVAVGCLQKYGRDYKETFSPVMKSDTLRMIIAYAMMEDFEIHHFDVEAAYLYGKLSEEIYMEQPSGYEKKSMNKKLVCKLNQAIYGLKQSGKVWFETLQDYLLKFGFKNFNSDKCVFVYENKDSKLILGLYVDDMLVINSDKMILETVMMELAKNFKIREVTNENNFLGMQMKRDENQITITQERYTEEILKRFNMEECSPVSTPMEVNVKLENFEGSKKCDGKKFQEIIGSLMYLSTKTRPDITYPITALSKYNQDARELHMTAAKRILRYLKGTKHMGLVYKKGERQLKTYTDASWRCGKSNLERSITGCAYLLGDNLISWTSKTQNQTSLSTCDAELDAITTCIRKGMYLKVLMSELSNIDYKLINIYSDNKAAIFLSENGIAREKSQHLIRSISFIHENLKSNGFKLNFVSSENNFGDILTKALCNLKHYNCLKGLNFIIN